MRIILFFELLIFLQNSLICQQYATYIVVSKNGDGDYTTIQEAVNSCKSFPDKRITIYVKKGVYREKIVIHSWNTKISLIGEDRDSTIITYNDAAGKIKNGTFYTYTLKVCGNDFIAENLTIENTAGEVGQAVALHVEADRVIIKNCNIKGNQDTLFASGEGSRQYYQNCYIEGTTDYIFGPATAIFEKCILHSKKDSYITAASTNENIKFGFVFIECKLTFAENISKVYLGRPWRKYAKTVFINCDLGDNIAPEGWKEWANNENLSTTFYAEYRCYGSSANSAKRVAWSHQLTNKQAKMYKIENIFSKSFNLISEDNKWFKN